jgi:DNA polymerase elongation subunit (family B)
MLNLFALSRSEIRSRQKFHCNHGHNGISHPKCYDRDKGIVEKVGILDIETEALDADYGIVFSYCFKVMGEPTIYYDIVSQDDFNKYERNKNGQAVEDTRIIQHLIEDLKKVNRIVGHYSSGFDLPFLRTRAVICGLEFPVYKQYCQSDTWMILKKKFKLSRNSLDNGARNLVGKSNKNHLSLNLKHGIVRGKKWARDYCLEHNRRDVLDTEKLYLKISEYSNKTKSSI